MLAWRTKGKGELRFISLLFRKPQGGERTSVGGRNGVSSRKESLTQKYRVVHCTEDIRHFSPFDCDSRKYLIHCLQYALVPRANRAFLFHRRRPCSIVPLAGGASYSDIKLASCSVVHTIHNSGERMLPVTYKGGRKGRPPALHHFSLMAQIFGPCGNRKACRPPHPTSELVHLVGPGYLRLSSLMHIARGKNVVHGEVTESRRGGRDD